MTFGLIGLALGSRFLLKEPFGLRELWGTAILGISVAVFSGSGLTVPAGSYDPMEGAFLARSAVFLLALCGAAALARLPIFRTSGRDGPSAAISSGLLFSMSNFIIAPFTAVSAVLLGGRLDGTVLFLFALGSGALVLTNAAGVGLIQSAFRSFGAGKAVLLQRLSVQTTPGLAYLLVFRSAPPSPWSLPLFFAGTALVLAATAMLAPGAAEAQSSPPVRA
jgi:hypothetical protein